MKKLISLRALAGWRPTWAQVAMLLGMLAAASLLSFRLGTLPARLSYAEFLTYHGSSNASTIVHFPLEAPYKFVEFVILRALGPNMTSVRMTSVVFALLAVVLFFRTALRWHGMRTAWLATTLFATSGWLLHTGRSGTVTILWLVLPLVLIPLCLWLERTKQHAAALITTAGVFGLSLFVSGAIWFVLVCLLISRRALAEHIGRAGPRQRLIAGMLLLLCLAALAFTFYRTPGLLRPWLGVPKTLPSVQHALKTWAASVTLYPFLRGPASPGLWLSHTPILDAFTAALTLVGAFFYGRHLSNIRARLLASFVVVGSLLTALNGFVGMNLLVPVAYLLAATGLTYTLHKWLTVFPRNPLARIAGVGIVSLAVVAAVGYHCAEYFIAWPHNPATTATFHYKPGSLLQ